MANTSPDSSVAEPPPRARYDGSGIFARLVVIVIGVLVPSMIALICIRSYRVHEPSTAVVIVGDHSIDGAKVLLAEAPDASSKRPPRHWEMWLTSENGWQTPVLLDPGEYRLHVIHRGHEILSDTFELSNISGVRFDLKAVVMIEAPNGANDMQVEISPLASPSTPKPAVLVSLNLTQANRFRSAVYLYPGAYRVVARPIAATGQPTLEKTFMVDHSGDCRVDLGKVADEVDPVNP